MNYDYTRHYLRGWLLHFFGRTDGAYAAYEEAFRHNRNAWQAAISMASIAAGRKNRRAAEFWFREALRIRPEDADTWFNLGFVLDEDGQREPAIEAFRESVRIKPAQDRAWYGMGLVQAKCGAHGEAVRCFQKVTELQPMNGYGWYQLGMAHHHSNNPDEVTRIIQHLLGFEPKTCRLLIRDAGRSDLEHLTRDTIL